MCVPILLWQGGNDSHTFPVSDPDKQNSWNFIVFSHFELAKMRIYERERKEKMFAKGVISYTIFACVQIKLNIIGRYAALFYSVHVQLACFPVSFTSS